MQDRLFNTDRSQVRLFSAMLGAVLLFGSAAAAAEPAPPAIVLVPGAVPNAVLEVRGLSPELMKCATMLPKDDARWKRVYSVRVAAQKESESPPMLGSYEVTEKGVRFRPRFPLERGLTYQARFDSTALPAAPAGRVLIEQTIVIPKAPPREPARLSAVFPSGAELPENLLRVYLHFSAPMQQGDSYRFVRIVDEAGKPVERPFLELPQELWNSDGTRLTLLLDPGRVKQGLKPRDEAGPVLVAGRNYVLQVDKSWPDAEGTPLAEAGIKKFRAVAADAIQPDVKSWKIAAPHAGSRDALSVRFPEPLDEAMLHRAVYVMQFDGGAAADGRESLAGKIEIAAGETEWKFVPKENWALGRYAIVAATTLEDRAGNSIGRAFEVDLRKKPAASTAAESVSLGFEVTTK